MTIRLNHTIVPAHDNQQAARWFAQIFGLKFDGPKGHFAPVKINDGFTLLFDNRPTFGSEHYAFHVTDAEFDAIFRRVKESATPFGSAPGQLSDGMLNDWNGGRGGYFKNPDGHVLGLMTVPQ